MSLIGPLLMGVFSLVCMGDSITDTVPDTGSTLSYCQRSEYNVVANIAVSGETSASAAAGLPGDISAYVPSQATVVSVMLGVNDASTAVPGATYGTNMLSVVTKLKAQGATKIILHTPSYLNVNKAYIDAYDTQLRAIAAGDAAVEMGFDARGLGPTASTAYKPDQVHWNDAGHALGAAALDYYVVPEPAPATQLATATLTLGALIRWRMRRKRSSTGKATSTS